MVDKTLAEYSEAYDAVAATKPRNLDIENQSAVVNSDGSVSISFSSFDPVKVKLLRDWLTLLIGG
jgi:hypothetical protein